MGGQFARMRAVCKIVIDGEDVTDRFEPHLLSLIVTLYYGGDRPTCDIQLDDRDASLRVPGNEAPIVIYLGWRDGEATVVFNGVTSEIESGCFRKGGGRTLSVFGSGHSELGKIKSPVRFNMGDGSGEDISLKDFLEKAAGFAGVKMRVHKDFDNVKRKFWSMNESFKNLGQRLATELGGAFSIEQSNAAFLPGLGGFDAMNESLGQVDAIWGDNLLGWRIKPYAAPSQYEKATSEHFDEGGAIWKIAEKTLDLPFSGKDSPFGNSTATFRGPNAAPNAQVAEQSNDGVNTQSQVGAGVGFVLIDGEPMARPGCLVSVKGARPGVDGVYLAMQVEHLYSRTGFTTRIQLESPMGSGNAEQGSSGSAPAGGGSGGAPAGGGTG